MKLNTIQVSIFKKLSKEMNMDVDSYLFKYSEQFIGVHKRSLAELSEKEGDIWINKAYVDSLKDVKF
ncbi:hypothetical protein [Maridesulfovibrio sp.]|uniref:hypothetical protein n=1 Tax=Maridesulfovibrio sp. TaxID=2795000 RepID=UPI0039EFAC6A